MLPEIEVKKTIHPPDKSTRVRILENWHIHSYPGNNPNVTIHTLRGQVTYDRGADLQGFMRFTTTSPIAKCEGNVVTTASGSVYYLGTPSEQQEKYSEEHYISPEHCNPWLNGNNWLTI